MRLKIFALAGIVVAAGAAPTSAEEPATYDGPVIDMHLHAYTADGNGPPGTPLCPELSEFAWDGQGSWIEHFGAKVLSRPCPKPIAGSLTDEALRDETIAEMRRLKVRGLLGGSEERVADWMQAAPDLFWPARHLNPQRDPETTPESLAADFAAGEIVAIAEITGQYSGIMVDDPRMEPFWSMAEREGLPVGVHIGLGPPGAVHMYPSFRAQSPSHLADVLGKHPKLRIFVMHGGYPYIDDLKALLWVHPDLMIDIAVLQFALPRAEFHAFLAELVRAGFGDRIMFGSDQMNWPGAIGLGIEAVNEADYLTYDQKKAILHDNAARFLRLDADGKLPD